MILRSVRATAEERRRPLPGDTLIPAAIASWTNAITIRSTPAAIWPWLAQMGAGSRGGWYSYDWLDNGRRPSANRVIPELQAIDVGTLFPAAPGATDGFHVLALEPVSSLVIGWRAAPGVVPMMTWAFVLAPISRTTRLIVRVRGGTEYPFYGLPAWIGMPLVRCVHFVMERRQLHGLALRVERSPGHSDESSAT